MHTTNIESEPPQIAPRVATFFALYTDPLGIADGTAFCATMKVPIRG